MVCLSREKFSVYVCDQMQLPKRIFVLKMRILYIESEWTWHVVSYVLASIEISIPDKYQDLCNTHYDDVIVSAMASQITSLTIVYSSVYSSADQRKYQSSASLAFVRGIHRWTANSPHKTPVTRRMFPFDDVIITSWRIQKLPKKTTLWVNCWAPSQYKNRLSNYGIVYYKDITVMRPSYLYHENSYMGKTASIRR